MKGNNEDRGIEIRVFLRLLQFLLQFLLKLINEIELVYVTLIMSTNK
jgi:hypothetical protein